MSDLFPPPPWTTEMQWHGTAIKATGQTLARVNIRADPWVEAATARLIAAAPDLLNVLERLERHYAVSHKRQGKRPDECCLWCVARSAIASAYGLEV